MALVETGKMTDIKLGGTDVQLVLQGSKVIWERDRYPEVVWPEEYYKPKYNKGPYGQFHLSFFIPSESAVSLWFGANASDCEGEGGGPRVGSLSNENGIIVNDDLRHISQIHPLTASTGNVWVTLVENFELTFDNPGNIFDTYGSKGMFVSGGEAYRGEMCSALLYIGAPVSQHFPEIEFFGIAGEHGGCSYSYSGDNAVYQPYWTQKLTAFTGLKWLCSEDTTFPIPLYMSNSWTAESMKFTVKNSPNATFKVDDSGYWHSIIPWEMAEYYNVTFTDREGNRIFKH